jgi:pimeloyl-ACP methyl ester carboxylesterase
MTPILTRTLMKTLPDPMAFRLMISQIGKTAELAMLPAEEAAFSRARPLRLGPSEIYNAFEWGTGPLTILVHGWGGRAAQMAPLAVALANNGYRCVAIDISGNGAPGPRFTKWSNFIHELEGAMRALNTGAFAVIGHSSGGTTMMAARRNGRIRAQRYVCICSPSYPFLSIDSVRTKFNPRTSVMERYQLHLAKEFELPWDDLAAGGSFRDAGHNLLLAYAENDRLVPHQEGDRIHALCPGSVLVKTGNHGHRSILTADRLAPDVLRFFAR